MQTEDSKRLRDAIRAGVFANDPDGFKRAVDSIYALERAAEREAALQEYREGKREKP